MASLLAAQVKIQPEPGAPAPVSNIELASRLSYFLWSSMPDDELLRLAESGKLRAALDAQVKRMIADRKFAAFAENFAGQWLETRSLDAVKRDAKKFPEWNAELKDAMRDRDPHVLRERCCATTGRSPISSTASTPS